MVYTNTRELITDLDANNSCIGPKKELLSKGTAMDDIHSQSSVDERTKGSQTKQRKLRDCDQQYDVRDTDGLICPPLALKVRTCAPRHSLLC